jgi:hypothetical protein
MNAALKTMFTFRQIRDLDMAAWKDSSLGHRDLREAAGTFGNRVLSWRIDGGMKPPPKCATSVKV